MKTKEIIKLIEADGWYEVNQKGSHKQFKHPVKKGLVTVPVHRLSNDPDVFHNTVSLKKFLVPVVNRPIPPNCDVFLYLK